YGGYDNLYVPRLNLCLIDHLLFSESDTDSFSARLLKIESISSLSIEFVLMFSFSQYMCTPKSINFLTNSKQSIVLLANRLIDFVKIKSLFPFSQSDINRSNPGRLSFLVPVMPSSL